VNAQGNLQTANWGPVSLRLAVGLVFTVHGAQKLFLLGLGGTAGYMTRVGIPLPSVAAVVVTAVELLGGLALILGLGTRLAAALLAVEMLVAILTVHITAGFFSPRGVEFPLTLLGASLTLALLGAGPVSLDKVISRRAGDTAG
jgi:putative oxidoreductase